MKTKIIYISGNETFEMTQIRAAFEEVRSTLGLDKDTILFGVPVDCDDAMDAKQNDVAIKIDKALSEVEKQNKSLKLCQIKNHIFSHNLPAIPFLIYFSINNFSKKEKQRDKAPGI